MREIPRSLAQGLVLAASLLAVGGCVKKSTYQRSVMQRATLQGQLAQCRSEQATSAESATPPIIRASQLECRAAYARIAELTHADAITPLSQAERLQFLQITVDGMKERVATCAETLPRRWAECVAAAATMQDVEACSTAPSTYAATDASPDAAGAPSSPPRSSIF